MFVAERFILNFEKNMDNTILFQLMQIHDIRRFADS
jgi:hypothetical protein